MKTSVLLAILAVVALGVALHVFSKPPYPMTEQDAKNFFLEDLKGKYPSADIREVMAITNATDSSGAQYYQLKARVTNGLGTPCPERIHLYYDYPPKNFVSQPEFITKGCKVCINEPVCTLAFPEEAVIASHTYGGAEKIEQFIRDNSDALAKPEFMDSFGNHSGVWLVKWSSQSNPSSSYSVILSKTGNRVLEVIRH